MADIGAILNEFGTRLRKLEGRERGSVSPIVSIATSQALKAANQTALVNASGGTRTLTLPPVADSRYVIIAVKKTDASANLVILDGFGAETIDGALTHSLTAQYDAVTIWASGGAWYIIGENTNAGTAPTTAAYVLGQASYNGALSAEIPVPRYGYHPDQVPASPGSLDDEFETGPTGWTWLNQGGSTATVEGSWLQLYAINPNNELRCLAKTAPATPWTVTALILPNAPQYVDYMKAGLFVRETASGRMVLFSHVHVAVPEFVYVDYYHGVSGGWNSSPFGQRTGYFGGYFRITDDGTDLKFYYSPYPVGKHFRLFFSASRTAWLTTTGPDQVGIFGEGSGGSVDQWVLCDWFRET